MLSAARLLTLALCTPGMSAEELEIDSEQACVDELFETALLAIGGETGELGDYTALEVSVDTSVTQPEYAASFDASSGGSANVTLFYNYFSSRPEFAAVGQTLGLSKNFCSPYDQGAFLPTAIHELLHLCLPDAGMANHETNCEHILIEVTAARLACEAAGDALAELRDCCPPEPQVECSSQKKADLRNELNGLCDGYSELQAANNTPDMEKKAKECYCDGDEDPDDDLYGEHPDSNCGLDTVPPPIGEDPSAPDGVGPSCEDDAGYYYPDELIPDCMSCNLATTGGLPNEGPDSNPCADLPNMEEESN